MDKLLYTLMNGAKQTMASQTMRMHNLANVDTIGFREDLEKVQSQAVKGGAFETRVHVVGEREMSNFSSGPIVSTGRDLDVAIEDKGWFTVVLDNGEERYTRAGAFHIDALGRLLTADGKAVTGDGGPIILPEADAITIGKDGTISIQPKGQGAEALANVERLKLVSPNLAVMSKGEDGYFYRTDGVIVSEADVNITVRSGALEGSNTNAISTLAEIINFARQYEVQIKMIEKAQDISSRETQMMSLR